MRENGRRGIGQRILRKAVAGEADGGYNRRVRKLVLLLTAVALAGCFGPVTTGDLEADVKVAEAYETGTGVPMDTVEAVKRYTAAAKAGSAKAQFRLGVLYYEGAIVRQDLEQSAAWFQKASDQGLPQATFNLANAYRGGYGVDRDYGKALAMYKDLALRGYAPAAHNAGAMYGNGEGTPQNYAEAYLWLHLSSLMGMKEDEAYKRNFVTGLPKDEVKKIEAAAATMLKEISASSSASSGS